MSLRLNIFRITGCIACGIVVTQISWTLPSKAEINSSATQKSQVIPPPLPVPKPPIEFFRELLSMSPGEREKILADKTPEQKKVLQAKIQEYEAMDPDQRELTLKVTELRWYLAPLMKIAPNERASRLEMIPEDKRRLVEERLRQWDELSPGQQQEFWDNEMAINYFLRLQSSAPGQQTNILKNFSPAARERFKAQMQRWHQLPVEDRDRMCRRFQQFFELNPKEKEKTLNTLSEAERIQMEKTLELFQNLSPAQRQHCMESFRKFARMDPNERNQFLKKAERWQSMSPEDRKAWRELVQKIPPMPPLPPGLLPPLPPDPRLSNRLVATNSSR